MRHTWNMKCAAGFRLVAAAALAAVLHSPVEASFEPLPVGARAAGMGEAYSAIVDDVFSLYYNPAGVLQVSRPEVGTYYSQLYPGLTDGSQISRMYLGYAQPFGKSGRHALGASYLAMELPGLYKEEAIGLTYGRESNRLWNYGMTVKMLKKSIGSDDYSNNAINPENGQPFGGGGIADPLLAKGTSKSAIGLDLGGQYRLSRAYAIGIAARNINGPNLGLEGSDKAPSVLTAAIARRLRAGSIDFEVTNWKSAGSNMRFALGGEKWFKNGFGLRGGGAFGSNSYQTVSFGASYKLDSFQFDFGLVYPMQGIEGTLGIQQISLVARFGKPPVDPLEQQLVREKEERVKAETEARNAIAERDRLKKQLMALTSEKSADGDRRAAAQKALEEAQAEAKNERGNRRAVLNSYTAALADYNAKVSQGVGLPEKRRMLEKIQSDFAGKGIDLSKLTRELRSLKDEESKAKKDFDLSMSFYSRLAQQGSSTEERRSMLERIIQKYKEAGIDVRPAEEELRRLK
jgi:hypothetical protein